MKQHLLRAKPTNDSVLGPNLYSNYLGVLLWSPRIIGSIAGDSWNTESRKAICQRFCGVFAMFSLRLFAVEINIYTHGACC